MQCPYCGNSNKRDSRFCRHCGKPLSVGDPSSTHKASLNFLKKIPKRYYVILIGCLFIFSGVAYAAVKGNDYIKVNVALGKAQQLNQSGDFQDALADLNTVKGITVLASQKASVDSMMQNESGFIQDQTLLLQASTSIATGDLQGAETILASIPTNFPQYDIVKDKMVATGQGLSSQASQAQAAAVQATQAKAAAQAQATAAAAAKAQAEAQAAASAQQEQQEQEQAQAQATAHAAQMRQTAINALQSIYDTFDTDGISNYNEAIQLYNAGDDTDSVNYMTEAMATFKATGDSITQFDDSYTNLDNDIATAALTLEQGDNDCSEAGLSFVEVINGTSEASITNSYHSTCISDANSVYTFLNSQ